MEVKAILHMKRLVKRQPIYLRWFKDHEYETIETETIVDISSDDVSTIEPYINDLGQREDEKAIITLKNNRELIVNNRYTDLTKHKQTPIIKGFFYGN